ncbi:hydroxyacid oxidase 1 [Caerostris extrusa]|uniref:Hydroxyacid oxidase 1 n=1 Tax=Caerostris extrusa TaxID=172846 RepID=A0AAV4UQX0_CAEEX|nr:hydroxyacid oxidase 1 [Caerostris extrusa]
MGRQQHNLSQERLYTAFYKEKGQNLKRLYLLLLIAFPYAKGNRNIAIVLNLKYRKWFFCDTLCGDDAKAAVECGVSAIIVSNHGGRLIEKVVPTLEVLEEVVDAVNGKVEVYLDGGIRSGSDVFIALALGAKSTFIGRPAIWGLSLDGENGVRKVLQILKEELLMTMQLAGAETVEHIKRSMVVKI